MRRRATIAMSAVTGLLPFAMNACASFQAAPSDADSGPPTTADGACSDAPGVPDGHPVDDAPVAAPDAPIDTSVPPPGCNGKLACERYVFVTKANTFTGSTLGGVAGANQKCTDAANASANNIIRGRAFIAWLSTSSMGAVGYQTHGTMQYRLVNGSMVANDFVSITNGSLDHAIDTDESGNPLDTLDTKDVITGTGASGGASSMGTCGDWTGPPAVVQNTIAGNATQKDTGWTNASSSFSCDAPGRLYCFEK